MAKFLSIKYAMTAALLLGGLAVAPAHAGPAKKSEEVVEGELSEKEIARSIEVVGLVFPVFDEKDRLRNYLFANARFMVADGKDIWEFREKSHFIRDYVIRAAHRESFHKGASYTEFDTARAAELVLKAANNAVGDPGGMVEVKFSEVASQDR